MGAAGADPSHLGGLWRGGAVGHPITTADLWEASDALPEELPKGTEGAGHSLNLTKSHDHGHRSAHGPIHAGRDPVSA